MATPVVPDSTSRVPGKKKVKHPPLPRVEVKTEDVYAMIDASLTRITAGLAVGTSDRETGLAQAEAPDHRLTASGPLKNSASRLESAETGLAQPTALVRQSSARGDDLERAIERMERRLGIGPKGGPDS